MNTFGIFVKQPVAGRVKTRLGKTVGNERAAEIAAAFIADVVRRFRNTADERFLCFAPDNSEAKQYFQELGGESYGLWAQPETHLGDRMARFFADHLSDPAHSVVIVGADSPTLPREFVEQAFEMLKNVDCVLGPATDGGYYLIGMRGKPRDIFSDVDWSDSRVLEQTVTLIERAGGRLAVLPPWYDVDTWDNWCMLRGHVRALQQAGRPVNLEATRPLLDSAGH